MNFTGMILKNRAGVCSLPVFLLELDQIHIPSAVVGVEQIGLGGAAMVAVIAVVHCNGPTAGSAKRTLFTELLGPDPALSNEVSPCPRFFPVVCSRVVDLLD